MNNTYNFGMDLPYGVSGEHRVVNFLSDEFGYEFQPVEYKRKEQYDYIGYKGTQCRKIEVKTDRLAESTGNIFVETGCKHGVKKTGILNTDADVWTYFLPESEMIIAFKTEDLQELIYSHHATKRYYPTHGVLIPLSVAKVYGVEFNASKN